ncbi:hypothetical protein [Alcanivorax sp.]|uniref:hypothetical protein n=1 Tax=Alcanivorax sp. TaxID=1872427 RepID=UPI0032D90F8A
MCWVAMVASTRSDGFANAVVGAGNEQGFAFWWGGLARFFRECFCDGPLPE